MIPIEQHFPVVLFMMLYKMVPTYYHATEQYFPVVLFIMLYRMVLTFMSVDEIIKCDH